MEKINDKLYNWASSPTRKAGEAMSGTIRAVPIDVLATPRDGECLTERWWVTTAEGALIHQRLTSRGWSPQCNSNEDE